MNRLGLFEIVRGHGFGYAGSWIAFQRSREMDLSRCTMVTQCFPYGWSTGRVYSHPEVFERATNGASDRAWPNITVKWSTSRRSALAKGEERASSYFANNPHPTAAMMPPMYDQSSLIFSVVVAWPLMGVQPPIKFHEGIEYGSWSQSASVDEVDEVAKQDEGEVEWAEGAVDVTTHRGAAVHESVEVCGFTYGVLFGGDGAYQPTGPAQPAG